MQEADKRVGNRQGTLPVDILRDELGYLFAPLSLNEISHGWHGNAILYRNNMTCVECKHIDLPQWEPRGAVSVVFRHPNGCEFECIGVHLGLGLSTRKKQIKTLLEYVNNRKTPYPTVITGDFNEWRPNSSFKKSLGTNFTVYSPGASFHTAWPILALDYFILWGEIEATSIGYIHKTEFSRKGSDHFPIVLNIGIPDKKR